VNSVFVWPVIVFSDGACKENVQAAMQAAWLASDTALSAEIAKRYGLYGRLCLRCAQAGIPYSARKPDMLLLHLCESCTHEEYARVAGFVGELR
jgi:hypothetical protein